MAEDNNKKENKQFSFIQEQITSKKKSKLKRMLFSVLWTIVLGCIFGCVGALAFCLSAPKINKILGREQDKKTVEFTVDSPEDEKINSVDTISPEPTKNTLDNTVPEEQVNTVQKGNNTADVTDTSDVNTTDGNTSSNGDEKEVIVPNQNQSNPTSIPNEQQAATYLTIYEDLRKLYVEVNESLVTVNGIRSVVDIFNNEYDDVTTTSGLIVFNNGKELLVLVNLDGIKSAKRIQVSLSDYLQVDADIQAVDSDLNLAIIAVPLDSIPTSKLASIKPAKLGESYSLTVGTPVLALGNPNGHVGSMEYGMITNLGSYTYITDDKVELFHTDITYNENGNGVIVDMDGEVVGIITNKLKDDLNQKISTVIGISKIKQTIQLLANNTERVYFGIKAADMTESALKKTDITNGICVTEVEVDSPALEAGLQCGDILLSVNDTPVVSVNSFHSILSIFKPKDTINVRVRRSTKDSYKDMDMSVILTKKTR